MLAMTNAEPHPSEARATLPPDQVPAQVRVLITGRVQGVYFRANTVAEARGLALTGWVRNLADGSVEALAEGTRGHLTRFVTWCHHGPPMAQVDAVEAVWGEAAGEHGAFTVRH